MESMDYGLEDHGHGGCDGMGPRTESLVMGQRQFERGPLSIRK